MKFLETNHLIPWQQKGNRRKSRETIYQLLTYKLIASTAKNRRKNLRMINNTKTYDSVPRPWVLCLDAVNDSHPPLKFAK